MREAEAYQSSRIFLAFFFFFFFFLAPTGIQVKWSLTTAIKNKLSFLFFNRQSSGCVFILFLAFVLSDFCICTHFSFAQINANNDNANFNFQ